MASVAFDADDAAALAHAVELAERGRGEVEPNPPVGAVIHRETTILAEGFHVAYGEAHAEVAALASLAGQTAGAAALGSAGAWPRGASLAVTLEPCSSSGSGKKQPPCVEALLRAKVARVVIGELDPDPRHSGRGVEALRAAGVDVVLAPPGTIPARLLSGFREQMRSDRPWVVLKWAQGLDGRWSGATPAERWISCEESRAAVHRLRAQVDAILVGSGTVLADDPRLTARPSGPRPLVRIVVDARGRVPAGATIFRSLDEGPVWWVTGAGAPRATPAGVERVELAAPHDLAKALLPELKRRGIRRLLVEGGPTLAAAFLRENVVDRARVFVAPVIHGGGAAGPALGVGAAALPGTTRPRVDSVERIGCDALFKLSWS